MENSRNEICFIGGISASGKTTAAQSLESMEYCHSRIHEAMFHIAEQLGIPREEVSQNWQRLSVLASEYFATVVRTRGPVVCDVHFSIQPRLDTAFALGEPFEERFDADMEPYQQGLDHTFVDALIRNDALIRFVLLQASPQDILKRRIARLREGQRQRSLSLRSIVLEQIAERYFFVEAIQRVSINHVVSSLIIDNPNPLIDGLLSRLVDFVSGKIPPGDLIHQIRPEFMYVVNTMTK